MIHLVGRTYIWMTLKLSNLLKNMYLQSSFSLVTTVFPSVKVQTASRKAIKSICNLITLLVLVWWTGIFCQTFLALCSAAGYGVAFKIGRFPGQTSLCTQQSLRTQPGYEVPNEFRLNFRHEWQTLGERRETALLSVAQSWPLGSQMKIKEK